MNFVLYPPPPLLSNCPFVSNVRVNSSREHPLPPGNPPGIPRQVEKLFMRAIFVGKFPLPVPTMMVKSLANPRPPKPCDQYTKVLVAIFN